MITRIALSFPSAALLRPVSIQIAMPSTLSLAAPPYRCLWALHCAMESGELFFESLNAATLVEQKKIAIIAPSLGNGYFINTESERQADFLNELLCQLPRILPLSTDRKDNAAIGISMGGYGALRLAFSTQAIENVAAISPTWDCVTPPDERIFKDRQLRALYTAFSKTMLRCLLDEGGNPRADANLELLAKNAQFKAHVFLYCGDKDYISLSQTQRLQVLLESTGVATTMDVSPGGHDTAYWHKAFHKAVDNLFGTHR